jgi:hypothetical protein
MTAAETTVPSLPVVTASSIPVSSAMTVTRTIQIAVGTIVRFLPVVMGSLTQVSSAMMVTRTIQIAVGTIVRFLPVVMGSLTQVSSAMMVIISLVTVVPLPVLLKTGVQIRGHGASGIRIMMAAIPLP